MPAVYDLEIEAGTTARFIFAFGDLNEDDEFVPLDNMEGCIIRVSAKSRLVEMHFSSDVDGDLSFDPETATADWVITPETSRDFQIGRLTRYEVEVGWSNGDQNIYLQGHITTNRGENDD